MPLFNYLIKKNDKDGRKKSFPHLFHSFFESKWNLFANNRIWPKPKHEERKLWHSCAIFLQSLFLIRGYPLLGKGPLVKEKYFFFREKKQHPSQLKLKVIF